MSDLEKAAEYITGAKNILFLSGAGISAESGIPTFRGEEGLYKNRRAEYLATPQAFTRDPEFVWGWYNFRKDLVSSKEPNAAHRATTELKELIPAMLVVTQNVDGFHREAGVEDLVEMHGNIFRARCTECPYESELRSTESDMPRCEKCEGLLRPAVVWFGESLDAGVLNRIFEMIQKADLMLVVGTSGIVYPAAGFSVEVRRSGGRIIEINPDKPHSMGKDDIHLQGSAAQIMPELVEEVKKRL